jgi:hypothetical protein
MDLLQNLLGGGAGRQEYEDYIQRYDRGAPYDGISDDEVYNRYQQIAPHLPPDMYEESAREAFSRMSPQERMQFGQYLQQQAQQRGFNDSDDQYQDPGYLAGVTGRMHRQQPDLLGQFFGGGMQQRGGGGLLSNPLAKAALGGIAAMAVKKMMSGGGNRSGGNRGGFGGIPT